MNLNGTLQCCRTGVLISGFIRLIHRECVILDLIGLINSFYWIKDSSLDWESINFRNESEIFERKNRNKLYLLSKLLDEQILNYSKLKQMCWKGIPSSIRPQIWKLLLKYTPKKLSRRAKQLQNKRNEYNHLRKLYFEKATKYPNKLDIYQQKLLQWTELDIKRMQYNYSENKILQTIELRNVLQRILYMFGLKHSCIGYYSGILDILIIIILSFIPNHTLNNSDVSYTYKCTYIHSYDRFFYHKRINWNVIEADSYWCLENLFESKQLFNNYTNDFTVTLNMVKCLKYILKKINYNLYLHFENERVDFNQFWQWIHNFLARKMNVNHIMKIWDAMLCLNDDEFNSFHVCVCVSLVNSFSTLLLNSSFGQIVLFIQSISAHTSIWKDKDVDKLLAQAFFYHELFAHNIKTMIKPK
eukprot:382751_1